MMHAQKVVLCELSVLYQDLVLDLARSMAYDVCCTILDVLVAAE